MPEPEEVAVEREDANMGQADEHNITEDSKASAENSKAKYARRKRMKKKQRKQKVTADDEENDEMVDDANLEDNARQQMKVEIQYVAPKEELDDIGLAFFAHVFQKFTTPEELTAPRQKKEATEVKAEQPVVEEKVEEAEDETDDAPKLSKKARRRKNRLGIADLKQLVKRPDVVEIWDTTAADPRTLVFLKSYRNTIPVPRHWCQKRKYLQGKRGIEKPPFKLPAFIEATGIQKIRDSYQAKEDDKKAKQKQRDRMAPKLGRVDINYQVLHDAFFKFQTKPELSIHGDLYYEGKEFEVSLKAKRPGALTAELREALGMGEGAPPPWLINMQRYGPPPSYPNLRIPGINAPIPLGCEYGYGQGQWGKPPLDEQGRPLYGGNPFDPPGSEPTAYDIQDHRDRKRWGQMVEDESSDEEVEGEEPEQDEPEEDGGTGTATPAGGVESSITGLGLQTPDAVDLRKAFKTGKETPSEIGLDTPAQLFQVLPEKQTGVGGATFGSEKLYQVPQVPTQSVSQLMKDKRKDVTERVQVSLNPEELENMDETILKQKYAEQVQAGQGMDDDDDDDARKRKKGLTDRARRQREFKF